MISYPFTTRTVRCLGIATTIVMMGACSDTKHSADPAYDMKTMMQLIVQPQADVFWRSAGTISDANGVHDLTPKNDAEWLRTRSSAAVLAEMGALLQTAPYSEGKGDDWNEYAEALKTISLRAEKAAADNDAEAVMEIGSAIYNVCASCHQAYQPAVEPEAIPGSGPVSLSSGGD